MREPFCWPDYLREADDSLAAARRDWNRIAEGEPNAYHCTEEEHQAWMAQMNDTNDRLQDAERLFYEAYRYWQVEISHAAHAIPIHANIIADVGAV